MVSVSSAQVFLVLVVSLLQEARPQKICLGLTILQMGYSLMHPMWAIFHPNQKLPRQLLPSRLSCFLRFCQPRPMTHPHSLSPSNSKLESRLSIALFFPRCGLSLSSIPRQASTGTLRSKANIQPSISSAGSRFRTSQRQKRNIAMALSSNYAAN